jgi:hypothetical protein
VQTHEVFKRYAFGLHLKLNLGMGFWKKFTAHMKNHFRYGFAFIGHIFDCSNIEAEL